MMSVEWLGLFVLAFTLGGFGLWLFTEIVVTSYSGGFKAGRREGHAEGRREGLKARKF